MVRILILFICLFVIDKSIGQRSLYTDSYSIAELKKLADKAFEAGNRNVFERYASACVKQLDADILETILLFGISAESS